MKTLFSLLFLAIIPVSIHGVPPKDQDNIGGIGALFNKIKWVDLELIDSSRAASPAVKPFSRSFTDPNAEILVRAIKIVVILIKIINDRHLIMCCNCHLITYMSNVTGQYCRLSRR